jgi:hypothetical protein
VKVCRVLNTCAVTGPANIKTKPATSAGSGKRCLKCVFIGCFLWLLA